MHRILERQLRRLGIGDAPPSHEQWTAFLERVDQAYTEADQDRYTLERALDLSSAEMRKRFDELRSAQKELVSASRKAGMADVATTVLHNVGNVLNSVNVSANVVADLVKKPTRDGLSKSLALLGTQPQPGRFLDEDPRGKKLLTYLGVVDKGLGEERAAIISEVSALTRHLEHIKSIVNGQLATAKGDLTKRAPLERVNLSELAEDALSVLKSTLYQGQDVIFRHELESIAIETDRHKLFQIVMNLLTNARDAVRGRSGVITFQTRRVAKSQVAILVADNGVGIGEDMVARIFTHGFTTKEHGHGFGLHASACAAGELGGSLTVESGGVGSGAVFKLTLPIHHPSSPITAASPSSPPNESGASL